MTAKTGALPSASSCVSGAVHGKQSNCLLARCCHDLLKPSVLSGGFLLGTCIKSMYQAGNNCVCSQYSVHGYSLIDSVCKMTLSRCSICTLCLNLDCHCCACKGLPTCWTHWTHWTEFPVGQSFMITSLSAFVQLLLGGLCNIWALALQQW